MEQQSQITTRGQKVRQVAGDVLTVVSLIGATVGLVTTAWNIIAAARARKLEKKLAAEATVSSDETTNA